jgi:hypothetical protein
MSNAKLEANRANAQRSTGPRTSAGKARSARNALRHGLNAAPSQGVSDVSTLDLAARMVGQPRANEAGLEAAQAEEHLIRIRSIKRSTLESAVAEVLAETISDQQLVKEEALALALCAAADELEVLGGLRAEGSLSPQAGGARAVRMILAERCQGGADQRWPQRAAFAQWLSWEAILCMVWARRAPWSKPWRSPLEVYSCKTFSSLPRA